MNCILQRICVAAVGVMLLTACAEEPTVSYNENEKVAFRAWMELHHPELLANYQPDGDYYVDVLEAGAASAKPFGDSATWVRFSFSGRNLGGDIVLSRNEVDARLVGTYTKYTHYVPYFKYYAGDRNSSLLEGTYLAMRNKLTLGKEYASQHNLPEEFEMRQGSKVTLYMPSSVVSTGGMGGTGGYEGQAGYELRSGCPLVVTMAITDTVRNPLQREGSDIDAFARNNGGFLPPKPKPKAALASNALLPDWTAANDSIPHVYILQSFKPTRKFSYPQPYQSIYAPYSNFAQLEQNICDTLVNRFGVYDPEKIGEELVTLKGTASIWYIVRFLDGFIIDSNIPGVRQLIFGETKTTGTAMSYTPENGEGGAIQAFYYTIPLLRYGQWASMLTSSANAYGSQGVAGKTNTSTTSNNYDYSNYYNSMNGYYGANDYYGGYGGYYGGYMGGQYGNYNVPKKPSVTTTTIDTEIPPYTPLLFEIYIEPKK
ncbi:MAG: hypothetical protein RSB29_02585 [Alistipes sp.]